MKIRNLPLSLHLSGGCLRLSLFSFNLHHHRLLPGRIKTDHEAYFQIRRFVRIDYSEFGNLFLVPTCKLKGQYMTVSNSASNDRIVEMVRRSNNKNFSTSSK